MLKHFDLTQRRITQFTADLKQSVYPEQRPLSLQVFAAAGRITYAEAMRGRFRSAAIGETFGPLWATHWFKAEVTIPAHWRGKQVDLRWNSNSEACLWIKGQPVCGFAGRIPWDQSEARTEYRIVRSARGGERLQFAVEMACNTLFGEPTGNEAAKMGRLERAEIALFDREAWDFYWDMTIISDMIVNLPNTAPRRHQALAAGNQIVNAVRLDDRQTWPAARRIARDFLAKRNSASVHRIAAVGHSHIDTAWLWPLAETRRKCYRTFSAMIDLMEQYPEFIFACSQARQFAWIKQDHPRLYARIRKMVLARRFIPVGGTWVEPDCNIPSGESLVRQFLFGQRFFRREFGFTPTEFWNPDVFGYNGQLPQIIRGAGLEYFLTQKLSWNQFNKPANHTFYWEGIDGSRVLTHFPPADTYNAIPNVKTALFESDNFKDPERAGESYMLFGFGDGGGGPTRDMLEQARRLKNCEGVPPITMRAPADFFKRCARDYADPLVISGELYFEFHRGTYTSQAAIKRDNRAAELLLHDVELLAAVAHATRRAAYPHHPINALWETTLVNQFHDILPGSSIAEVYADAARDHARVRAEGAILRTRALKALCPMAATRTKPATYAVFNTLGHVRHEVMALPYRLRTPQKSHDGQPLAIVNAPAIGHAMLDHAATPDDTATVTKAGKDFILENRHMRVRFDNQGGMVSLFDKALQRDALAAGGIGNRMVMFEDKYQAYDAWDVEVFHLEKNIPVPAVADLRIIEQGPLRSAIEITRRISASSVMTQRIFLAANARRLEFETEVDWHETAKFLKVEFPWNIRCEFATYEIQFGHLRRPTTFNNSLDMARFEVCAHKWMDYSEPGFGVALLNDCKYGHSMQNNIMRLSLLRAPKYPDPGADIGRHRFRYALVTHAGDFRTAGVIQEAHAFNAPLLVQAVKSTIPARSWFTMDHPGVIIDTIKKAEDSDALVIRMYEAFGGRGTFHFHSSLPIKRAVLCDLMEQHDRPIAVSHNTVALSFTPFAITTLKISV